MKVILTQEDIEQALVDYVGKLVTVQEGFEISVEKIIAGRGDKGLTAEVDISEPKEDEPVVVQGEPKKRKPRQRKATVETGEDAQPKAEEAVEEVKHKEQSNPEPVKEDPPFVPDEDSEIDPEDGTAETAVVKEEPKPVTTEEEAPKRPSIFNRAQRPTNS